MYSLQKINRFSELLSNISDNVKSKEICEEVGIRKSTYKNKKTQQTHHILKYDKKKLNEENYESLGLARSIIVDNNGKILCFAPPKSFNNLENLKDESMKSATISIEDFVEGTMMNLYYVETSSTEGYWEVSTRSNIGANNFYMMDGIKKNKTFRQMFDEICAMGNFDYNNLPKNYIYSFVMRHPENRIVQPVPIASLFLTNVYAVNNETLYVSAIPLNMIGNFVPFGPHFQTKHIFTTGCYEEIKDSINKFISLCKETEVNLDTLQACLGTMVPYSTTSYMQGFVFEVRSDTEIYRYKVRNHRYEELKKLKGNQAKLQYHYLCLRQNNKVKDFIKVFGYAKEFNMYRDQLHQYTWDLYQNYVSCYINKEKPLNQFGDQYRTHMYLMHQEIYMKQLKPNKLSIKFENVKQYVNTMKPEHQMYVMNYLLRTKKIDDICIETMAQTESAVQV